MMLGIITLMYCSRINHEIFENTVNEITALHNDIYKILKVYKFSKRHHFDYLVHSKTLTHAIKKFAEIDFYDVKAEKAKRSLKMGSSLGKYTTLSLSEIFGSEFVGLYKNILDILKEESTHKPKIKIKRISCIEYTDDKVELLDKVVEKCNRLVGLTSKMNKYVDGTQYNYNDVMRMAQDYYSIDKSDCENSTSKETNSLNSNINSDLNSLKKDYSTNNITHQVNNKGKRNTYIINNRDYNLGVHDYEAYETHSEPDSHSKSELFENNLSNAISKENIYERFKMKGLDMKNGLENEDKIQADNLDIKNKITGIPIPKGRLSGIPMPNKIQEIKRTKSLTNKGISQLPISSPFLNRAVTICQKKKDLESKTDTTNNTVFRDINVFIKLDAMSEIEQMKGHEKNERNDILIQLTKKICTVSCLYADIFYARMEASNDIERILKNFILSINDFLVDVFSLMTQNMLEIN